MEHTWDCKKFMFYPPSYSVDEDFHHNEANGNSLDVLIIANCDISSIIQSVWGRCKLVICADGGANRLFDILEEKDKWIPNYIKGDFDSVSQSVLDFYEQRGATIIHDSNQDTTDLEKCMELVSEYEVQHSIKFRTVLVVGSLGGSFTHEMANCNVLYKHPSQQIVLWSLQNALWLLTKGSHKIYVPKNTKCGILPFGGKCKNITTTGLKWNLTNHELEFGALISTSNVTVDSLVTIHVSDTVLWTIDFVK